MASAAKASAKSDRVGLCHADSLAQYVLMHNGTLLKYVRRMVTVQNWGSVNLLFLALCFVTYTLTVWFMAQPQYFAFSAFDEWVNHDWLFQRADRILSGPARQRQRPKQPPAMQRRGQRVPTGESGEKPRHMPQHHRQWLREAEARFGPYIGEVLREYEDCGRKVQKICLLQTVGQSGALRREAS